MTIVLLISLAISAVIWLAVAGRLRRIRHAAVFLEADATPRNAASDGPFVSILVPARNEARDLPATLRSLLNQEYQAFEIIVVDDESIDDTADVARAVLQNHSASRVLAGAPRPDPGWVGKTWALTQAFRVARGDWLLFTDADIEHHPAALRRALDEAETKRLDVVTLLPAMECRTLTDRLVLPLFALLAGIMDSLDPRATRARGPARLSGAFILIRRATYQDAGGHEAVRGEIIEDMALAQRLRQLNCPVGLRYTRTLLRTHMYDGAQELWQGLTRFAYPMLGLSPLRLAMALATAFFATLVPVLALAVSLFAWRAHDLSAAASMLAGGALWGLPCFLLRDVARILRVRRIWMLALPVGALALSLAAVESAMRFHLGRGVEWKGRRYAAAAPASGSEAPEKPAAKG